MNAEAEAGFENSDGPAARSANLWRAPRRLSRGVTRDCLMKISLKYGKTELP